MRKTAIALCLAGVLLLTGASLVQAQADLTTQIEQIRKQVEDLQTKLEALEKVQTQSPSSEEDKAELKSAIQDLRDVVQEPEGPIQTAIADVNKLKKLKVSGYVQARYESYQTPIGVTNKGNNLAPDNRFYLRRGRFKITGQPTDSVLGVVQLDISGYDRTKVESKDLYLEFHPWGAGLPAPFFVRMGQQNWPFGYVIERSSSAREVPERPKVFAGTTVSFPKVGSQNSVPSFSGLFPGERDKGICLLNTDGSKVEWALGLFNGTGTKSGTADKSFLVDGGKFEDNNASKTIVGRVRYPISSNCNLGGSFYKGAQAVMPVSNAASSVMVSQSRYGADIQFYLQGASIKAEYVTGKEPYYSNTSTTANGTSGTNRTVSGWYIVGVKNLGPKYQAVAQYDVLDDKALASSFGKLKTWNLGLIRFLDDATKLKLFYEINNEEKNPARNNGLRAEVITVF